MLIVVCGLVAEARIVAGEGVSVLVGGGASARLARDLDALCREDRDREGRGVPGLISFGVAGGLAPGLAPGTICVADAILTPSGVEIATDAAWRRRLASALAARTGPFATADAPVAGIGGKAALHRATSALTVDMESHVVAEAAARHDLPLAALRVVTDPAGRALPHAASVGMRADGRVDLPAILLSLAHDPRQLPGLIRTGLDARLAFASLLRCRQLLGPNFGLSGALLDL